MKATPIPERSRTLVRVRERHRCARCAVPSPNGHWHHRRSRSVRDLHQHCPCNGVWLCPTCHAWVHAHPADARASGMILSRSVSEPWDFAFKSPLGWVLPDCQGGWKESI